MPELDLKRLKDLYVILEEETNLYRQMVEFAREKKDLIVENRVEELMELVEKEEERAEVIEELEEERTEIFRAIIGDSGSLSTLIGRLEKEDGGKWHIKFSGIRDELLELLFELQSLNEQNRLLVEEALKLNRFTMNLVRQARGGRGQKYDGRGQALENDGSRIIDRQV